MNSLSQYNRFYSLLWPKKSRKLWWTNMNNNIIKPANPLVDISSSRKTIWLCASFLLMMCCQFVDANVAVGECIFFGIPYTTCLLMLFCPINIKQVAIILLPIPIVVWAVFAIHVNRFDSNQTIFSLKVISCWYAVWLSILYLEKWFFRLGRSWIKERKIGHAKY